MTAHAARPILPEHPWIVAAAIALTSVLVYAGTFDAGYPFDDQVQVADNAYIRNFATSLNIFSRATWPGYVYRPLPTFTYALTYALVGNQAWLYHLTSVLLHAVASVLVFFCLRRIFDDRLSAVAALLFAVHPAHVEAIASIANRTELLVAVFGLAGLLVVLPASDGRGRGIFGSACRVGLATLLFLLALLAKESAVCFYLLLPLVLLTRKDAAAAPAQRWAALRHDAWPGLLALVIASASYFTLRSQVLSKLLAPSAITPIDNWLVSLPPLERITHAFALLGRYVSILLLPHGLSADYSYGSTGLAESLAAPDAVAYVVLACAVAAFAVVGVLRSSRKWLFFGGWFLASFAVTSNIAFPIGVAFADRLAYLPSVAICGLIAWGLLRIGNARIRVATVAAITLVFSVLTVSYGEVWHDNRSLFLYEVRTSPGSARVHVGIGGELFSVGAYNAAREHFDEALRIYPTLMTAAYGIALIEFMEGDPVEGHAWLARSLEMNPDYVPSLNLQAQMLLDEGRVDDAGRLFVRALNADHGNVDAKIGILSATLERGNLTQAAVLRDQLLAIDPTRPDLVELSRSLDRQLGAGQASGPATLIGTPG